jgi:hypothetical protein
MTPRPQHDAAPASRSLPALVADQHTEAPPTAVLTSTLETDMHLIPEQMARNHLENRYAEAERSRIRRIAHAARRAHAAERRARLAREAAVLAAREAAIVSAR